MTLRQIIVLIILIIFKHRQNICQDWKWANYLLSKLSFMALFSQTLLFTQVASTCWYFLLLLGYFLYPLLSTLLQVVTAISNNTFTSLDFWTTFYTTVDITTTSTFCTTSWNCCESWCSKYSRRQRNLIRKP